MPLAGADPIRTFSWRRGQRHRPGLEYLVSTSRHHGFESLEEARTLLALDFAGDLADVVSQPLRLRFGAGGKWREHTPDFLAVTRSGAWLIDVRPEPLIKEPDAESFAASAELALACGWRFAQATRLSDDEASALTIAGWAGRYPPVTRSRTGKGPPVILDNWLFSVPPVIMVGGVLGAPVAPLLQRRLRPSTMAITMTLAGTVVFSIAAVVIPSPLVALPVAVVVLLSPAANSGLFAAALRQAPEEMRGRVTSTVTTTAMALAALAPLLAGLLVEHVSASWAVGAFAGAQTAAAVLTLVMPGLRDADPPPTAPA